jgi:hypothetical protein
MSYIPSINIEYNTAEQFRYIVTENSKLVLGSLVNGFNSGHHSFTVIGTYGTGKSSFIVALEHDLKHRKRILVDNRNVFGNVDGFEFLKVVGDYASLSELMADKLQTTPDNVINALSELYNRLKAQRKFLFVVVDELGKVLEHAANNNPEKELYFLQKLAEYVNAPSRNIILLTTLHQNFGSYAGKLTQQQRNEWLKVKGRFTEVVFAEPVEQLLFLTARQLETDARDIKPYIDDLQTLFELGKRSGVVADSLSFETAEKLFPLDPISATCLTLAIQRYGQNERSLFSFLSARGLHSLGDFDPEVHTTYNVAKVVDYLKYYFYSAISETNADSTGWRAIAIATERVENSRLSHAQIDKALRLIKTIGMLNMLFNGISLDIDFLETYAKHALGIADAKQIIEQLTTLKVIRYADYKSQYILYEGTNIDIENELYKASLVVPVPSLTIDEIAPFVHAKVSVANASYYRTGTPRYFDYRVSNEPLTGSEITGDVDGIINLLFPLSTTLDEVILLSGDEKNGAVIYAYFNNTREIAARLHTIKKLQYVIDNVAFDDRVAKAELLNQKEYELRKLNEIVNAALTAGDDKVTWVNRGEVTNVNSARTLNNLLSQVSDAVYNLTPIIRNELINRQKVSSAISLARVNLLDAMLNNADEPDFGFAETAFPPEKTIYYTLFRNSGIHRQDANGNYVLGAPVSPELDTLWQVCTDFVRSCTYKPRMLSDLVEILQKRPYKLKQGVIDFWIPIFLFVYQQDFAIYNGDTFVLNINKELFELIQKRVKDFSIRAFEVSGVKLEFFKKYRQFLNKDSVDAITTTSFIDTIKPFFQFYRGLNHYAKNTRKFDNPYVAKFRDVLSKAQDPSVTFFEALPAALGYSDLNSEEFVEQYISLIKSAVRDLNRCYDLLIDRIESHVVEHFGFPQEYSEYKALIEQRYRSIDAGILTPKSRSFLDRVLAPSDSRKEFFEKIAIIVTDKRLDETKDSEESMLTNNIIHLFSELERYSAISAASSAETEEEAFNIELASSKGKFAKSQTFRLPKSKAKEANRMAQKIESLLTGDNDLDVCVLLKMLNERIK